MNTKRFLGAFLERRLICTIAGFGAALLFLYRDDALGLLLTPWAERTAQMTASILRWLGEEATRSGRIVSHPGGFAYEVHYHCVGFLPAAALVASRSSITAPGQAQGFVLSHRLVSAYRSQPWAVGPPVLRRRLSAGPVRVGALGCLAWNCCAVCSGSLLCLGGLGRRKQYEDSAQEAWPLIRQRPIGMESRPAATHR